MTVLMLFDKPQRGNAGRVTDIAKPAFVSRKLSQNNQGISIVRIEKNIRN
jgi:hypothetical protein